MRALTDSEKAIFETMMTAENVSLVSTEYDGRDVGLVVAVFSEEKGSAVLPLAILLEDADFDKLKPPFEEGAEYENGHITGPQIGQALEDEAFIRHVADEVNGLE